MRENCITRLGEHLIGTRWYVSRTLVKVGVSVQRSKSQQIRCKDVQNTGRNKTSENRQVVNVDV